MENSAKSNRIPNAVVVAAILVSVAVICGLLYWAQAVLIPLALASLLTFMLTPVIERLERWQIPRIPAVVLVAVLGATLLGVVGWTVGAQLNTLAKDLPSYQENIKGKIGDLRDMFRGGAVETVQETIEEINDDLDAEEAAKTPRSAKVKETAPVPVPVQIQPASGLLPQSASSISPVLEVLATAGLVFVLVVFMLIKREDLLNRLISLAGIRGVTATTKALQEAGQRISRYLLAQIILNGGYGLVLSLALWMVGVPYAFLWGFCAAIFRYVPYIGPWVAALLPISVSIIHFPGWSTALMVVAIFVILEIVSNNVLEPWLYGSTVGLSEVAVIVAAVLWTLLWGPVGLVLATPMTVCLVVLGKYIPAVSVFDRLLSSEPALKAEVWLYQRLLARNQDDAEEIVHEELKDASLEAVSDELLLPTLALAKREWLRDRFDEEDQQAILEEFGEIIESLAVLDGIQEESATTSGTDAADKPLVIGFPIREYDDLVLKLFERLEIARDFQFERLSSESLVGERLAAVLEQQPVCVCISSLPPGDLAQTRQICKRLHANHPDLKIIIGRWDSQGVTDSVREEFSDYGATRVVGSFLEMREALRPIVQLHGHKRSQRLIESLPGVASM